MTVYLPVGLSVHRLVRKRANQRRILFTHVIMQSFHQHEDALLPLWVVFEDNATGAFINNKPTCAEIIRHKKFTYMQE